MFKPRTKTCRKRKRFWGIPLPRLRKLEKHLDASPDNEVISSTTDTGEPNANSQAPVPHVRSEEHLHSLQPPLGAPKATSIAVKTLKGEQRIGLFPLHEHTHPYVPPRDKKSFPIDIVAVHGLSGDAFTTWTHGNDTNWVMDFLPKDFPGARIYTYGYPADMFSLGTAKFPQFARNLLENLHQERMRPEDKRRPIIFICHSMGGIVVKKALNIAVVDHIRYQDLRESVQAILFLATPHRGSSTANFASVVSDIINIPLKGTAFLTGKLRSDLLKSVAQGSEQLDEVAFDFRHQTNSIKIWSFTEEMKTRPARKRIVDNISGRMGVPDEVGVEMLGCDHRTICRFKSEDDNSYRIVRAVIHEAVEGIMIKVIATIGDEDIPCLQFLSFPEMEYRRLAVTKPHSKTCSWILTHEKFLTWAQLQSTNSTGVKHPTLLWIKGHPGTGKSTLMTFIHDMLRSPYSNPQLSSLQQSIRLSFFFDFNGGALQKSPIGMYRSLLHQAYSQSLSARQIILQKFQGNVKGHGEPGKAWGWQRQDLEQLLFETIVAVSVQQDILVMVDALDEAMDDDGARAAKKLVEYFHELDARVRATGGRARICISCRHYPVVSISLGLEILVERENRQDLYDYVEAQFALHVDSRGLGTEDERQMLVDAIVQKADGLFLWASLRLPLMCKSLNDGMSSFRDIHQALEEESSELSTLYKRTLEMNIEVSIRSQALQLLQWVCLARRPMSLTELRYAMVCDTDPIQGQPTKCEESRGFIQTDERMEKLILSLSGGLASVRHHTKGSTVQLIHKTVDEYLRKDGLFDLEIQVAKASNLPVGEVCGQAESGLAIACINYLRSEHVLKSVGDSPEKLKMELPFIEYATMAWVRHAEQAENCEISKSMTDYIVNSFDLSSETFEAWKQLYQGISRTLKLYLTAPENQDTLLHVASSWNLPKTVIALLGRGAIVEEGDRTALQCAARWGHVNIVKILLDHIAETEAKHMNDHQSSLEIVSSSGGMDNVNPPLNGCAGSKMAMEAAGRALQTAAGKGQLGLVNYLLDLGADMNMKGGHEGGALQAAAAGGYLKVVKELLLRGADISMEGGEKGGALQAAAAGRHIQVVKELLLHGADINAGAATSVINTGKNSFPDTPSHGEELLAAQDVELGKDVQKRGLGTALYWASSMPYPDMIRVLLDHNADVNAVGGDYGTALQAAAPTLGAVEIIQLLLSHGADVNAEWGIHGTALQIAAASGVVGEKLVQFLLDNGASVDVKGGYWGNSIQAAAYGGSEKIVRTFLARGLDLNESGGKYGNVFEAAAWGFRKNENVIRLLLQHGADPNLPGKIFGNALEAAVALHKPKSVQLLLESGMQVDRPTKKWDNVLQLAAATSTTTIVEMLLDHGVDVDLRGSRLIGTPLYYAISYGNTGAVELLLERGAEFEKGLQAYDEECEAAGGDVGGDVVILKLLRDRRAKIRQIQEQE